MQFWASINLPWGHARSITKFGPDRFCSFDVYWTQTDNQRNRQTSKVYIDIIYVCFPSRLTSVRWARMILWVDALSSGRSWNQSFNSRCNSTWQRRIDHWIYSRENKKISTYLFIYRKFASDAQRPNLNNLSRVSNLRLEQNWNCIQCFEIWACAQFEPVFGCSAARFKFSKFCLRIPTEHKTRKSSKITITRGWI